MTNLTQLKVAEKRYTEASEAVRKATGEACSLIIQQVTDTDVVSQLMRSIVESLDDEMGLSEVADQLAESTMWGLPEDVRAALRKVARAADKAFAALTSLMEQDDESTKEE